MKVLYVTRHFNHSGYLILEGLIANKIKIDAVLLHKDNDKWRHPIYRIILKKIYAFKCYYYRCKPIKNMASEELLAKKHKIPIIWTDSIKSDHCYNELKILNPDIIVLGGGWHELIPERVYAFPKFGCINTHPSLLPEFRGTSITRWQVLHGIEYSGSTIHYVDGTFDTGGVLAQKKIRLDANQTPQQLFYELGNVGAEIMVPLLQKFKEKGKLATYKVDHNPDYYQYFKKWQWNEKNLEINWSKTLKEIHFHILANTQESFEYLGPFFHYGNDKYFVRESVLKTIQGEEVSFLNGINDFHIHVYATYQQEIWLVQKGSPFLLKITKIQKYDSYYKFRRVHQANDLLHLKRGQIFKLWNNE